MTHKTIRLSQYIRQLSGNVDSSAVKTAIHSAANDVRELEHRLEQSESKLQAEIDLRKEVQEHRDHVASKLLESQGRLEALQKKWDDACDVIYDMAPIEGCPSRVDVYKKLKNVASDQRDQAMEALKAAESRLDSVRRYCEEHLYDDGKAYDGHSSACSSVLKLLADGVVERQAPKCRDAWHDWHGDRTSCGSCGERREHFDTQLGRAFAEEPQASIVDAALKKLSE